MSDSGSTIATIFRLLKTILGRTTGQLTPQYAPGLLLELGLPLTPAQAASLSGPLVKLSGHITQLANFASELEGAIAGGDTGAILSKLPKAISEFAATIDAIHGLSQAIGALNLSGVTAADISALPQRLFDFVATGYLGTYSGLTQALEFAGVLERIDFNVDSIDPAQPFYTRDTLHLDRIAGWITAPKTQLQTLYGWGSANFEQKLFPVLDRLVAELGLPVLLDKTAGKWGLESFGVSLTPNAAPLGLKIGFADKITSGSAEIHGPGRTLALKADTGLGTGASILVQPNGKITATSPDSFNTPGTIGLTFIYAPAQPIQILSLPGGSRLEAASFSASAGLQVKWNGKTADASYVIGGAIKGGKAVIDFSQGDGFLSKILSGIHLENSFDLGFDYSGKEGLHFHGSSALDIQLASHISLGPVELSALALSIGIANGKFPVAISTDLKASLGPMTAVVEGLGFEIAIALASGNSGNLGPLDIVPGFKPPHGVGLSIDAGPVKGGGYLYFDFDKGEYAGALELDLAGIVTAKAIGLISTKLPGGKKGFALLIIISVEFGTPIQLGFGFTLIAVGGLVGLNRSMNLHALAEGIRSGAVNSIMFPKNVIANAPKILSDLGNFFPSEEGHFLIGPMVKIGWGTPTLVSLALGVIIEIPPGDIAIVGVLKVALPTEDIGLIVLQVNFIGAIEPDKARMWFFASLYDSHVLFITLDGDMGLLFAFGEDANFVVSVGGFHPRFSPPPLPFPNPHRISIDILNTSVARIRVDGYFAVTSNSVQFGAHAELYFGFSVLNVDGQIGFDALVQFSPFHFIVDVYASLSVNVFGAGLFSLSISLSLEGPTPWRAHGSGSITILFFSVDVDIDTTWGESRNTTLPPIKVMPLFVGEFSKAENWRALPPNKNKVLVSLRKLPEDEAAQVLHPIGSLRITQRALPLNLTLDKVGTQKPSDVNRLKVTVGGSGLVKKGDVKERFAPAQYQNMDDAQKLSRPAFGPENAGLDLTPAGKPLAASRMVKRVVRYEQIVIDTGFKHSRFMFFALAGRLFNFFLGGASVARSELSMAYNKQLRPFDEVITVAAPGYSVAFQDTNKAYLSSATFASEASACEYMNGQIANDTGLAETLHVIPHHELAA
jgi:hypothetical protein